MQRALAIVAVASCMHHAPPPSPPAAEAPVPNCGHVPGTYSFEDDPDQGELVPGPPVKPRDAFDDVAFLDGCFGTFHIDAGWDVCFSRDADGLVGTITWHRLQSAAPERGALLITKIGSRLHIESSEWRGSALSANESKFAPGLVAFEANGHSALVLRRPDANGSLFATFADGHTVELKPRPPRAIPAKS